MSKIMSAGLCEILRTDPENGGVYRTRYERALTLVENQSTTELREAGAPLAREYGSWKNAKYRTKGLHASISDFKDFIRIHGPMPDDITAWSLDRINPVGPYAPFNIRWLDPLGQTRNRTNTLRLKFYGHDIHLQTIALILGIPYRAAYKVFSRDPDELVSRIGSASYRLKYTFPNDFSEELEAAFSKNVHGLMRLHWVQEYVQQEVMRLSDEIAETPDDPRLWLQHQHALSVLLHAAAFDKWAQEQQTRQIEFQRDLRSAGPLPTWELENIHFEPKPAPKYENFTN